jgi:hypothetical protein
MDVRDEFEDLVAFETRGDEKQSGSIKNNSDYCSWGRDEGLTQSRPRCGF